jgi:hypothetical protein
MISAIKIVRLRCPHAGRVFPQRAPQHPTKRRSLAHGPRPRGPLDVQRNAAHEIDACDRHANERTARRARARHLASPVSRPARSPASTHPLNIVKFMTRLPSSGHYHRRRKRGGYAGDVESERSMTLMLTSRSVPAATAAAMLGKPP